MQVVGIGMGFTRQHFAHYQAFQTATDGLYCFYGAYLQTNRGKDLGYGLCVIRQSDVAF
jgi:hypothetical protein